MENKLMFIFLHGSGAKLPPGVKQLPPIIDKDHLVIDLSKESGGEIIASSGFCIVSYKKELDKVTMIRTKKDKAWEEIFKELSNLFNKNNDEI